MASKELKKQISTYILPILFCGLLIVLALLRNEAATPTAARVIEAGEPLTLTDMALENYLYGDGFTLDGKRVLDGQGQEVAALTVTKGEDGTIAAMTLIFSMPAFAESMNSNNFSSLKAKHEEAAQRGENMFLSLFDAIAATDGRVAARRDSALEKLRAAINTGKAASQSANSWTFAFSLDPGTVKSTATIQFTLVK